MADVDTLDPLDQMRNLGICSAVVLFVVIVILGICYHRIKADHQNLPDSNGPEQPISTISENSSRVSLSTYFQPPPSYEDVIEIIFEERRKSMEECLIENEELPPSYQQFIQTRAQKKN